jgi:DNA replication factor GINS
MLTDETIRKIFEEEKNSQGLTRLPDNFFEDVKEYVDKKSRMARIESDKWALDSIKTRLKAIFARRERKILNSVHGFIDSGVLPDNLTPEEEKFFEKSVDCVKGFHNEREGSFETAEENLVLLTILEDIKRFVGTNMKNYGPYKKGDLTTMPEPNANLLIEKKLAEKTEIKN